MADLPPIQFKRSSTFGLEPNPSNLEVGELAINFPSSKIYTKDSDGNIVTLGFSSSASDSDVSYFVDSEGTLISEEKREPNITILTDGVGNSWQNSAPLLDAKVGTRVTVLRNTGAGTYWQFDSTVGSQNGWDSVISTDGIVQLDYAGVNAYAVTPSWYNTTYRLQRAYVSNGDHATLGVQTNYWIWQTFDEPVNIGNGTSLGTYKNGRAFEYFTGSRVTFYDVDDNILADQQFSHTSSAVNTISVSGNITGCKKIMMRGHGQGSGANPGFNRINFYVNGSTDYPTAFDTTNRHAAAYRNMTGGLNLADSDEAIVLAYVDASVGGGVGGAWNIFRINDWRPALPATEDQTYTFWFNKNWDMGPGTYANGRNTYQNQWWNSTEFETYDKNDNLIYEKNLSTPAYSATNGLPASRGVRKIIMRPRGISTGQPVIQQWYPDLGRASGEILNTYGVQEPELWIKSSSSPFELFVNGATTTVPPWVQLSTD